MATSLVPTGLGLSKHIFQRHRRAVIGATVLFAAALAGSLLGEGVRGLVGVPVIVGLALGASSYLLDRRRVVSPARVSAPTAPREEQLQEMRRLEAVGQLAGGVAHDFNNILTVIGIHSEFLLAELDPSAPQHTDAKEIQEAATRASMLTRQLLAFSRRQVLEMNPLSVNETVRAMTPMLRRLIGEDIEIRAVLEPEIGIVMADDGQLQQVIMNLAVNSRDAMPNGGTITITTAEVELDGTYAQSHVEVTPGHYVMLAVSDTGCGMSPDVRAHIFEPFFTTKPAGVGTGLGLATVFGIVRQSDGFIWVYSEPGEGTSFKIYLPLVEGQARANREGEAPHGARGHETILLVEDEKNVREATKRILMQHGYHVVDAANGSDAMAAAERCKGPLALLLTDVVLPEAHGPRLVSQIHERHPDARVLYMSGYTDTEIERRGLGSAANTLQKPFSSRALLRAVRAALDGTARLTPTVNTRIAS